jgi:hypothetical protein
MPKPASAKLSIVHIHDERRCWPPRTADLLHSAEWRCLTAQVGEPRSESPARLHAEPERHLPAVDQSADIVMAADEQRADTAPSARRPSADNHWGAMPNDALDPLPTAPADLVRGFGGLADDALCIGGRCSYRQASRATTKALGIGRQVSKGGQPAIP